MNSKIIFAGLLCLLCSCAEKTNSWSPGEPVKTELDESRMVFQSMPLRLKKADDSTVTMIVNRSQFSIFNVYTGKNIKNFSGKKINMDSLLAVTYNQYYKGKREYIYDAVSGGGITEGAGQISDYAYSGGKYYLYYSCEVEAKYVNDTAAMNKVTSDPKTEALLKKHPKASFHIMEFVQFIIVLDKNLETEEILPLYPRAGIETDYFPSFQLGYGVYKDCFYVPLLQNNRSVAKYSSKMNEGGVFFSLARLGIKDESLDKLMFSSKDMDYSDFSFSDYLSPLRSFKEYRNEYLFCSGKEIRSVEDGKSFLSPDRIPENEWISAFHMEEDQIYLATYTKEKKKNPTAAEVAYGVDSIGAFQLRLAGQKGPAVAWPLAMKELAPTEISSNEMLYLERDDEHYYLVRIPLNEN